MRKNQQVLLKDVTYELRPKEDQGRPSKIKWAEEKEPEVAASSEVGAGTII